MSDASSATQEGMNNACFSLKMLLSSQISIETSFFTLYTLTVIKSVYRFFLSTCCSGMCHKAQKLTKTKNANIFTISRTRYGGSMTDYSNNRSLLMIKNGILRVYALHHDSVC